MADHNGSEKSSFLMTTAKLNPRARTSSRAIGFSNFLDVRIVQARKSPIIHFGESRLTPKGSRERSDKEGLSSRASLHPSKQTLTQGLVLVGEYLYSTKRRTSSTLIPILDENAQADVAHARS